jgi:FADH2 O2-dependent halogenase
MSKRYGLPELYPLTHWGTWKRAYPKLLCGRKRGFTYFDQTASEPVTHHNFDSRRLLVSASIDDEHSDTHWLRSDVDQFIFELAVSSGVTAYQNCRYEFITPSTSNRWRIHEAASDVDVEADFIIDATGSGNALLKHLAVPDITHELKTNSRSVFAHFTNTPTCDQLLRNAGINVETFPYLCDDAAVHQVVPDGWMWQLRYDDNSLSAGFMIDQRSSRSKRELVPEFPAAEDEWTWRIHRTPFLAEQFREAHIIRLAGLQRTGRIQRLAAAGAGPNWAALTNTVGFIDPLHSTGIAHTLFAVSRLSDILTSPESKAMRESRLSDYSLTLIEEIRCVDELVEGCYQAIPSFRLWCLWGMLYFAAATSMEQQTDGLTQVSFLRANDRQFRSMLKEARERLQSVTSSSDTARDDIKEFAAWLSSAIAPWNTVGLFNDSCNGLYSSTAAPANAW